MINDVVDLIGKDIYVEAGSKYEDRIKNLNDELGGGIHIHHIDKDTVVTEELIEMVSTGEIPYTLADNNLAQLNRTYYNNIDIHLKVSFPQRAFMGGKQAFQIPRSCYKPMGKGKPQIRLLPKYFPQIFRTE